MELLTSKKIKESHQAKLSAGLKAADYAELHCITNFSFLRGASFPEELVERAKELDYRAIAITDECSVSGIVRAHTAAKSFGIKLIIGSEFILSDGCHLVLLAKNKQGYSQICNIITRARSEAKKGSYFIDRSTVEENVAGDCIVLWVPDLLKKSEALIGEASWLKHQFKDELWIAVELLLRGDDRSKLRYLEGIGARLKIPLCAAGGVYMHDTKRRILQDTITAIRLIKRIDELGFDVESNGQRFLRPRQILKKLFPIELMQATLKIASKCRFSLDELTYEYPKELVPSGYTAYKWLRELTQVGIHQRWPRGTSNKVLKTIEHELRLIKALNYEHYFLTVYDIVSFARSQNILCQGRGSAANSIVCYCLGITEVDPERVEVLFERFLSKERNEPPDIDVDFENSRREEVIQYIYGKYGRERASLVASIITYRSKSAIRDVGKALGLDNKLLNHLSKSIYWWGSNLRDQLVDANIDYEDPVIERLIFLAQSLLGFPRNLSQHVGGFVISENKLSDIVPIENAAMKGRTVIQWDKNDIETLGILKIDVLALGMLTVLKKSLALISDYSKEPICVSDISPEDPKVYDMICKADTVGVFQIESRAQMSMLPRLKPRSYYDLVIQIAVVRPGPIQGDMVHPYLNRRNGTENITYPSKDVREVLERTLGVPIFQEQVMQLAIVAAGFSGGEADQLRRAMAAWKRQDGLEPYKDRLIDGMLTRGYKLEFAKQLFKQIKGFGDYGFPESHSASFALIAYVSSWLKYYHPAAFCCALLNSQPMGFYMPSQLINDAKRHSVEILPIDINRSYLDSTLEYEDTFERIDSYDSVTSKIAIRIGFRMVKGLSQDASLNIVKARQAGKFSNIQELIFRSGINKRDLESLAAADALRALSGDRHRAFWQASAIDKITDNSFFADQGFFKSDFGVDVLLPTVSEEENIFSDYASAGFTLRAHPIALFRKHLNYYQVTSASELSNIGNRVSVKVVGLVTCRQRPMTAAGVTFLTLEDESGFINVVVGPGIGERLRAVVRQSTLMGVTGQIQENEGVIHLIAKELVDLSHWLGTLESYSRDFS